MTSSAESARFLRWAGLVGCVLVVAPPMVEGIGDVAAFAAWLTSFAGFGAAYAWTSSRPERQAATQWAALASEGACVVVMAATNYRGLEGTLLVLVALQLGLIAPPRVGLAWIVVQSLGLMWAIQHHWSLRPALMWAPPYLGFQLLTFLMVQLLQREARAHAELVRTNAELVATRGQLEETARVEERLRIARELHDAMGHHLIGLSLNLEAVVQRHGTSAPLDTARSLTRRLLDDVESLVNTLGEQEDINLSRALAALAVEIPRPKVHIEAADVVVCDPERTRMLWRCCQEIVTNAVKHADAENLWMTIQMCHERIELAARDDGTGASHVDAGHGLEGMRRRVEELGGSLNVQTRPGAGFTIRVILPAGSR